MITIIKFEVIVKNGGCLKLERLKQFDKYGNYHACFSRIHSKKLSRISGHASSRL